MAFSISYAIMNVGFLISALIFDSVRWHLGEHGQFTVPHTSIHLSTYRTLFFISLLVEMLLLPLLHTTESAERAEATDEGVKITPEAPKYPDKSIFVH